MSVLHMRVLVAVSCVAGCREGLSAGYVEAQTAVSSSQQRPQIAGCVRFVAFSSNATRLD
jgi:hypothetical protein